MFFNILRLGKMNGIFKRILKWYLMYLYSNFTEICSQGSNYQYANIDSDDVLVPNRRKAVFWKNVGLVYWRMYASLGLNGL